MADTNFFQEGSPYLNHPLLTPERTKLEVDFILSHVVITQGDRVLDVGCGPGRHSIELARRGYRVVGIDPSETMIQAAQMRAEQAGVSVKFIQEYGEHFVAQDKFDAVICLFTTLGQINDGIDDNSQLIQRIGDNLKFGGHFILEIPHREWLVKNLKPNERFGGGNSYTEVTRGYTIENDIVTELFNVHSPQKTSSFLLKYRVYGLNELKIMLAGANFSTVAIYGGFTEKPLEPDDPNIVIVSQLQL